MKLYRSYHRLLSQGLLASGHDLSEGGLAVALMECCIGGSRGVRVDLSGLLEVTGLDAIEALFSESAGRLVVSVDPSLEVAFLERAAGMPLCRIGETVEGGDFEIYCGGERLALLSVDEMTAAFRNPLYELMGMERG
jgi:phosphoribosylformylglycinamidine synthase